MTRPWVCAVMIAKNESAIIERNIKEWKKAIADAVFCVDTGSTDDTKDRAFKAGANVGVLPFTNFVDTKNAALELFGDDAGCGCDWILWIDADERPIGDWAFMRKTLDEVDDEIEAIATPIIERDANGADVLTYNRVRLWRPNGQRFTGPNIHEVIDIKGRVTLWALGAAVWHDRAHRSAESFMARGDYYVDTLNAYLAEHPGDPRGLFYLARTYKDLGEWLNAIATYREYIDVRAGAHDSEVWQAWYDMALCARALGEPQLAAWALSEALEIDRRAEALCLQAEINYADSNFLGALWLFEQAMKMDIPRHALFVEPTAYTTTPCDGIARCWSALGRPDKAIEYAGAYLDVVGTKDPLAILRTHGIRAQMRPVVVFGLGNTPEPLHGDMLEQQGAGGVETAHIELAKALQARGADCVVVCNTPEAHVSDGVSFVPTKEIDDYGIVADYAVAARDFAMWDKFPGAQKIAWLHDARFNVGEQALRVLEADTIVCSSAWHSHYVRQMYSGRVGGMIRVIGLGVNPDMLPTDEAAKQRTVIYSSNPNRGLQYLQQMWPDIEADGLVIAYGWDGLLTWSHDENWKAAIERERDRFMEWAAQDGRIRVTGRIPKRALYAEMQRAAVGVLPTDFPETYCLTLDELAACGTPLVCTRMSALADRNHVGLMVLGHPGNAKYQAEFVRIVNHVLSVAPAALPLWRSWGAVADDWTKVIWEWRGEYNQDRS